MEEKFEEILSKTEQNQEMLQQLMDMQMSQKEFQESVKSALNTMKQMSITEEDYKTLLVAATSNVLSLVLSYH
jgi:hypothetical protein